MLLCSSDDCISKASKLSGLCDKCALAREDEMVSLRNLGLTYQQIGDVYGISRQRVHQVIRDISPDLLGSKRALRKSLS